jgi:hypothetical protein
MAQELKNLIFSTLKEFNKGNISINWQAVFEDEEMMESMDEIKNRIAHNFALLDGISEKNKQELLGKLALAHAHLSDLYGSSKEQKFLEETKVFEQVIKEIMNASDWLTHAEKRYNDYEKLEEKAAEEPEIEHINQEHLNYLRPVFLAFDIFALNMIDAVEEEEVEEAIEDDLNDPGCCGE